LFVLVELRTPNPVVNLRAFRDGAFATGNVIMFTGFFCLFASIVLLPLYVQKLMGYTAFWAGMVLGPGGIASFFIMPVAGTLMKRGVNPRTLLAMGIAVLSLSLWMMSGFNLQADFMNISWPRIVQGLGMGVFFVPLSAATFVNIRKEDMGNASGIFNLLRNLGGSFGVAVSTTILAQRSQVHQTFLVEHVTPYAGAVQTRLHEISQILQPQHPASAVGNAPLAIIYQEVLRQASMLAFNDTFRLFSWLTAMLIPLTFLLRRPRGDITMGGGH
jgi:DHA2 family multidrug resistance protein